MSDLLKALEAKAIKEREKRNNEHGFVVDPILRSKNSPLYPKTQEKINAGPISNYDPEAAELEREYDRDVEAGIIDKPMPQSSVANVINQMLKRESGAAVSAGEYRSMKDRVDPSMIKAEWHPEVDPEIEEMYKGAKPDPEIEIVGSDNIALPKGVSLISGIPSLDENAESELYEAIDKREAGEPLTGSELMMLRLMTQ